MYLAILSRFNFSEAINKLWDKLGGWMDAIILKLPNFVLAVILMLLFYFLAKFVARISRDYLLKNVQQQSIKDISSRIIFAIVLLFGFFMALGVLELDTMLTSILAGAGVVGLAVGFALQATLSNSVSGVMLSFLPKIRIGDYIQTNGYEGFVSQITLRNIVLRQADNNIVVIPNSKIMEEPFTNYSLTDRSRIGVLCGIAYESDLEEVEALVRNTIEGLFTQNEGEGIEFFYTEFGDSSINFTVRFWINYTKYKDFLEARHQAIKGIKAAFNAEGVSIPFPIRTLDFSKNTLRTLSEE